MPRETFYQIKTIFAHVNEYILFLDGLQKCSLSGTDVHCLLSTGWRSCVGVVLEGKCYQFFQSPKNATDAEVTQLYLFI